MLLEELRESRHRDIEDVGSVVLPEVLDVRILADTLGLLEVADQRLGLLVHRKHQRRKAASLLIVQEPSLLEQKAQVLLASDLCPLDLADLSSTGVCIRNDLDQLRGLDIVCAHSSEDCSDVDVPESSEPDQALDGEDGAAENEGPFLTVDVLIVALLREVDGEEGGPDTEEGPDVVMKKLLGRDEGQRIVPGVKLGHHSYDVLRVMKRCRLYLRIIH